MTTFNILLQAFLTLAIFSFLYKDNPIYKFAEHLFVGVSAGYIGLRIFEDGVVKKLIFPLIDGDVTMFDLVVNILFPTLLGVMMLMRLLPSIAWVSRYPLAIIVGVTAGINFIAFLQSNALNQIENSILPIIPGDGVTLGLALSNLLLIFGTITGLFYFFFSAEQKGAVGVVTRIGVYFLMISFGASFGYTVMARISLLVGRFQFLLQDVPTGLFGG